MVKNMEVRPEISMRLSEETVAIVLTHLLRYMTSFFLRNRFKWLLPVILTPITDPLWPEPSGSDIFPLEVEVYGKKLKLMHSMILHKQVAIAMGLKRIFVISPNIRIEPSSKAVTGKHAFEFTQLDFEIEEARMKDVMSLVEELFVGLIKYLKKECADIFEEIGRELKVPSTPFKVYKYSVLKEIYGDSWEETLSKESDDPFWVISIPREFYDREDPEKEGVWYNYDLILPEGFGEVLSGGEREYDWERIRDKMLKSNLRPELFGGYIEMAKKGLLKPSAGAGIGVERLLRYLLGSPHIRDVQIFKRIPGEVPTL